MASPPLVGHKIEPLASTTGNQVISLTDLTGSAAAPVEDNVVLLAYAVGSSTDYGVSIVSSGWKRLCYLYSDDTYDTILAVYVKVMGATPDTSVTVSGISSTTRGQIVGIACYDGVDPDSIFNGLIAPISGTDRGQPDPAPVDPVHPESVVFVVGAASHGAGGNLTNTSSFLSNFISAFKNLTYDPMLSMGDYDWTSGTVDPPLQGGGNAASNGSWAAFTGALLADGWSGAILNPADKSTDVDLSNGNLTASLDAGETVHSGIRGSIPKIRGKFYLETRQDTSGTHSIGISDRRFVHTTDTYLGANSAGGGYYNGTGIVWYNGAVATTYATAGIGDIIGMAVDVDTKTVWYSKNGTWLAGDPEAGTGGQSFSSLEDLIYPHLVVYADGGITSNVTIRFSAADQSYSPPAGFTEWEPAAGGGASGAVGIAAETDIAPALSGTQILAAGRSDETDAALALSSATIAATGAASEADIALPLSPLQISPCGLSGEVDSALALGSALPVQRADESDIALALSPVQVTATGIAAETDSAIALSAVQLAPTGLSAESDAALVLGSARAAEVAEENDVALALEPLATDGVGLASEADTALALSGAQLVAPGIALETDAALALVPLQGSAPGLSTETDNALPLGSARPVGQAQSSETALALGALQIATAGLASESDAALALAAIAIGSTGTAAESNTALALSAGVAVATGLASETDTAIPLAGAQMLSAGLAQEADQALPLGAALPAGLAQESDAALALAPLQALAAGLAAEISEALALGSTRPVEAAAENDTAIALLPAIALGLSIESDEALALEVGVPVIPARKATTGRPAPAGGSRPGADPTGERRQQAFTARPRSGTAARRMSPATGRRPRALAA